jgi:hypothetical protein
VPDTSPDPRLTPLAQNASRSVPHTATHPAHSDHDPLNAPRADPQRDDVEQFVRREVGVLWVGMIGNILAALCFVGLAAWIIISNYRGVSVWPAVITTFAAIGLYILIERLADRRSRATLARLEEMQRTASPHNDESDPPTREQRGG